MTIGQGTLEHVAKVLLIDHYTWQTFRLRLLHLVNRLYAVIHKTQKSKLKVLQCLTVGKWYFLWFIWNHYLPLAPIQINYTKPKVLHKTKY